VSWGDRLRALRVDTTPLRTSRDFRQLFLAGLVFYLGGMVSYVALPYQLYQHRIFTGGVQRAHILVVCEP
jgi:hypothetical protein